MCRFIHRAVDANLAVGYPFSLERRPAVSVGPNASKAPDRIPDTVLFLAYQKREVVVIETCDGPIEICFSCGDEAGLRIGIDAPSSMRILRREGERNWCLPASRGAGDADLSVGEQSAPGDTTDASINDQRDPVPVFADTDDTDWWHHPDDVRGGISGEAEPVGPVPDDDAELWT